MEKVTDGTMAFDEEMKMIDICAVGPLRVTTALYPEGKIAGIGCGHGDASGRFGDVARGPEPGGR